jgi:hypothetical protein
VSDGGETYQGHRTAIFFLAPLDRRTSGEPSFFIYIVISSFANKKARTKPQCLKLRKRKIRKERKLSLSLFVSPPFSLSPCAMFLSFFSFLRRTVSCHKTARERNIGEECTGVWQVRFQVFFQRNKKTVLLFMLPLPP